MHVAACCQSPWSTGRGRPSEERSRPPRSRTPRFRLSWALLPPGRAACSLTQSPAGRCLLYTSPSPRD
eukprot:8897059-Alexandrium_andersonii.AAC.1